MINRNSESNIRQLDCEILQGGYILRFNEIEVIKINSDVESTSYQCQELFFDEIPTIEDLEKIHELSPNQIQFIVDNTYQNLVNIDNIVSIGLDELKQIKLSEFNPILNEFTLLISRAKLISGDSQELDQIINQIKTVKDITINKIQSFDNVNELMKFKFLESDINFLKNQLNPFLF